jgi:hypothetical protein
LEDRAECRKIGTRPEDWTDTRNAFTSFSSIRSYFHPLGFREKSWIVSQLLTLALSTTCFGVPKASYDAVGCGADLALGAMFATEGMAPEQRIHAALAAASTFSAGVAPPFTILKLENEAPKAKI